MERRSFLGALTAASLGVALKGSLTEFARAQNTAQFVASLPERAAKVREDRVKSLVYVAALAPDEGETVSKVFYREAPHPEAPKLAPDSHGFISMPEDGFRRAVAHKASVDQTNIAAAVQRPIAVQCIQEPAPAPLWKSKPSWFLIAEEDRMINPKTQHFMADRMGATVQSHRLDHTPMYSEPAVVIDVILEAARKTLLQ